MAAIILKAWRIVRANHLPGALSGEGAAKYGGRWNSRGVAVIYTSATRSLAALETLVHINPPMIFVYKIIQYEFSEQLMESPAVSALPRDWRSEPPPMANQQFGDDWVRQARSAVFALPSILIPEETNYIFNPQHPDFKKITAGKPVDFVFDARFR